MHIYLMRHGQAYDKEADPTRALNREGEFEVENVALLLKENNIPITEIFHSGVKRAFQTANIVALHNPVKNVSTLVALEPEADVNALINIIEFLPNNSLLVGHLPNIESLCYALLQTHDDPRVVFNTGCIVGLVKNTIWELDWYIKPEPYL